jgi:hypothetical protein
MGLYTHTTRAEGTVLTGEGSSSNIFNVDHLNHVTHTAAPFLNSWEDTQQHMDLETSPGTTGAPSLPASLSDEVERIRFVLSDLKKFISSGTKPPHWYTKMGAFSAFISFPMVAARLEQTSAQIIQSGQETIVGFDTPAYDSTGTMAATPPSMKAPDTGMYIVGATLAFGDGVTVGPQGDFRLALKRNLVDRIAEDELFTGTEDGPKALTVEALARFVKNDTLDVTVLQSTGTSKQTSIDANFRPAMWMAFIARTA